jgi:UDP-GlcNAc:undecaprenyl-phosphate/decaprenyl-phosphate GlcNAc-1-phosphate transferase
MLASLLTLLMACVLGWVLTPLAAKVAFKLNILDHPDNNLKKHERPVPYLGGLAVYVSFVLTLVAVKLWQHGTLLGVMGILTGATIIAVLGLIDDKRALSPAIKFAGQTAAALVLIYCNMRLQFVQQPVLSVLLSLLWVVGVTNAMNLIDVMDGLSTGVGVIAAAGFFAMAAISGRYNNLFILSALGGALLGFLPYNFPKARIYQGDTGALLMGFILSSVAMGQGYSRVNAMALLAPVLILAVPIFDTLFIMFLRQRRGVSMFRGSPDHLALRMVKLGLSRTQTVLLLWSAGAVLSAIALATTWMPFQWALLTYVGVGLAALFTAERMGSFSMEKSA